MVHCAHTEMVGIEAIVPNPRNPNTHPKNQIALLAKIIRAQGWRAPITVSRRSGFIVRGHGRYLAARQLGCEVVPVDYQDYATEAEEWADLIGDNKIAELSEANDYLLIKMLNDIKTADIDMAMTGFSPNELEALFEHGNTTLKQIEVNPPPRMAWLLIGVPIDKWAKISQMAEAASLINDSIVETTVTNDLEKNRQS